MMFDDIYAINEPRYVVKDYRESIEAVKEMQGGLNVAKLVAKTKTERELVDRLVQLADSIEVLLKAFPPAGTYQRIGD